MAVRVGFALTVSRNGWKRWLVRA